MILVGAAAHAPVLARLGVRGGCPLGYASKSAAEIEASHAQAVSALRGEGTAASRPALAFVLGRSTKNDARAWAAARGATCADEMKGAAMRCKGMLAREDETPIAIADAFFRFDAEDRIVGVDVMRDGTSAERASSVVESIAAHLTKTAGMPASKPSDPSAAYLAQAPLRRSGYAYRFHDYAADVSATNLGGAAGQNVVVREQYRAITDSRD